MRFSGSIALHQTLYSYERRHDTVQIFNSCTSQPDVCQCLVVQTPMKNMSRNKPNTSMKHVACELKLGSVVRSYIRPCQGKLGRGAIRRAVVDSARAAHAFSAGIKSRHCMTLRYVLRNMCLEVVLSVLLHTLNVNML